MKQQYQYRYRHRDRREHGFLATEVLVGLLLLVALTTALVLAADMRARTARHLADQRRAIEAAEEALLNLQTSGEAKSADASVNVSVQHSGQRVGEMEWVEVAVERQGRRASLTGLVPAQPAGGAP